MDLQRRARLSEDEFIHGHLMPRVPVVVTGEASQWPAVDRWRWDFLVQRFGDRDVDLYDDWFVPTGVMPFAHFVAGSIGAAAPDPKRAYVRWFARHRPGGDRWADDVFAALAPDWTQPSFLPSSGYVVPYADRASRVSAVTDMFPYRGLFVSAKSARTRLHRDPWGSAAVLCQVVGVKRVWMFSPDQEGPLMLAAATGGAEPTPAYEGLLSPGEVLFVPDGWWHHVTTLSDSVSLTWNFLHGSVGGRLSDYVRQNPVDPELEVVSYFLRGRVPTASTDLVTMVEEAVSAQRTG